eukprot:g3595.t1
MSKLRNLNSVFNKREKKSSSTKSSGFGSGSSQRLLALGSSSTLSSSTMHNSGMMSSQFSSTTSSQLGSSLLTGKAPRSQLNNATLSNTGPSSLGNTQHGNANNHVTNHNRTRGNNVIKNNNAGNSTSGHGTSGLLATGRGGSLNYHNSTKQHGTHYNNNNNNSGAPGGPSRTTGAVSTNGSGSNSNNTVSTTTSRSSNILAQSSTLTSLSPGRITRKKLVGMGNPTQPVWKSPPQNNLPAPNATIPTALNLGFPSLNEANMGVGLSLNSTSSLFGTNLRTTTGGGLSNTNAGGRGGSSSSSSSSSADNNTNAHHRKEYHHNHYNQGTNSQQAQHQYRNQQNHRNNNRSRHRTQQQQQQRGQQQQQQQRYNNHHNNTKSADHHNQQQNYNYNSDHQINNNNQKFRPEKQQQHESNGREGGQQPFQQGGRGHQQQHRQLKSHHSQLKSHHHNQYQDGSSSVHRHASAPIDLSKLPRKPGDLYHQEVNNGGNFNQPQRTSGDSLSHGQQQGRYSHFQQSHHQGQSTTRGGQPTNRSVHHNYQQQQPSSSQNTYYNQSGGQHHSSSGYQQQGQQQRGGGGRYRKRTDSASENDSGHKKLYDPNTNTMVQIVENPTVHHHHHHHSNKNGHQPFSGGMRQEQPSQQAVHQQGGSSRRVQGQSRNGKVPRQHHQGVHDQLNSNSAAANQNRYHHQYKSNVPAQHRTKILSKNKTSGGNNKGQRNDNDGGVGKHTNQQEKQQGEEVSEKKKKKLRSSWRTNGFNVVPVQGQVLLPSQNQNQSAGDEVKGDTNKADTTGHHSSSSPSAKELESLYKRSNAVHESIKHTYTSVRLYLQGKSITEHFTELNNNEKKDDSGEIQVQAQNTIDHSTNNTAGGSVADNTSPVQVQQSFETTTKERLQSSEIHEGMQMRKEDVNFFGHQRGGQTGGTSSQPQDHFANHNFSTTTSSGLLMSKSAPTSPSTSFNQIAGTNYSTTTSRGNTTGVMANQPHDPFTKSTIFHGTDGGGGSRNLLHHHDTTSLVGNLSGVGTGGLSGGGLSGVGTGGLSGVGSGSLGFDQHLTQNHFQSTTNFSAPSLHLTSSSTGTGTNSNGNNTAGTVIGGTIMSKSAPTSPLTSHVHSTSSGVGLGAGGGGSLLGGQQQPSTTTLGHTTSGPPSSHHHGRMHHHGEGSGTTTRQHLQQHHHHNPLNSSVSADAVLRQHDPLVSTSTLFSQSGLHPSGGVGSLSGPPGGGAGGGNAGGGEILPGLHDHLNAASFQLTMNQQTSLSVPSSPSTSASLYRNVTNVGGNDLLHQPHHVGGQSKNSGFGSLGLMSDGTTGLSSSSSSSSGNTSGIGLSLSANSSPRKQYAQQQFLHQVQSGGVQSQQSTGVGNTPDYGFTPSH